MTHARQPEIGLVTEAGIADVIDQARDVLDSLGVYVDYEPASELLASAGGRLGSDGRLRIGRELVDQALSTVPGAFQVFDRDAANPVTVGGDEVGFAPGSAATKVYDSATGRAREARAQDCATFAQLVDRLPAYAYQSTCVVPSDVPLELADRVRLYYALLGSRKPIVTGTFAVESFEPMLRMLTAVRGSSAELRARPLAIFDCCPSPPLEWSQLTCGVLVRCAEEGIPAELVSMPLAGATAPVTLYDAVVQHTAENLSGIVIHQLAGPGSPIVYGGSPAAFDMRTGTTPMGAVETMMIDVACSAIGRHLGLPTHAYMGLSDSKAPDYQGGLESGIGAMLAALARLNIVSGPGMLDFESCQSLEKLVLDHEACRMALRMVRGMARREEAALQVIGDGIAAEQFLSLDHTRQWFREEINLPGAVIDRSAADLGSTGGPTALDRARDEVERLLAEDRSPPLPRELEQELADLAGVDSA